MVNLAYQTEKAGKDNPNTAIDKVISGRPLLRTAHSQRTPRVIYGDAVAARQAEGWITHWIPIATATRLWWHRTLKTGSFHDADFVVTDGTRGCLYDRWHPPVSPMTAEVGIMKSLSFQSIHLHMQHYVALL